MHAIKDQSIQNRGIFSEQNCFYPSNVEKGRDSGLENEGLVLQHKCCQSWLRDIFRSFFYEKFCQTICHIKSFWWAQWE